MSKFQKKKTRNKLIQNDRVYEMPTEGKYYSLILTEVQLHLFFVVVSWFWFVCLCFFFLCMILHKCLNRFISDILCLYYNVNLLEIGFCLKSRTYLRALRNQKHHFSNDLDRWKLIFRVSGADEAGADIFAFSIEIKSFDK